MRPTKFAIILTLSWLGIFYFSSVSVRLFAVQLTCDMNVVAAADDNEEADKRTGTDKAMDESKRPDTSDESKPVSQRDEKMALILAGMAEKSGYSLKPEEAVQRISPPFTQLRNQYYLAASGAPGPNAPNAANAICFFWDAKHLRTRAIRFGDDFTLTDIVDYALKIKSPDFEGPAEFLEKRLEGDWVIRPEGPQQQVLKELTEILQKQFKTPVQLAFAKRVRTVYLVRGKYLFTPIDPTHGKVKTDAETANDSGQIEIFGKVPGPKGIGGRGAGDFKEFLGVLGSWINTTLIDEVGEPFTGEVSWHLNDGDRLDRNSKSNHDPEYVLRNITAQTGLTFHKDYRVVRRLVVESIE